jgi:hypothetical protein
MKKIFIITCAIVSFEVWALYGCGYQEKGHANTPAEHPGSQMKPGVDTIAHPGNMDRDSIHLEK